MRVALNELDRRLAADVELPGRPLGISSVVIGSSAGGGLPVEASVRALIDGMNTANARLGRLRVVAGGKEVASTEVVRFDVLELTERYEDRVDLIVGVLAQMQRLEDQEAAPNRSAARVTYQLAAQSGEGASAANPPIDATDEVWRRIDIRAEQRESSSISQLEFTSIGRLARAERLLVDVECNVIDPLLAAAVDRHDDPDISGTLYELLIPHELKGELGSGENLHLLVDTKTADWPFELLRPRADDEDRRIAMALRVGVLRQFRETEHLRFNVRRASGNNALVIGNPPTPGAFPLPGAAQECVAAAKVLASSGFDVDSLIWDVSGTFIGKRLAGATGTAPTDALHALLNGDWRVLHIAAHGDFTDDATTTGVLLGALRLTANTFSKMSVVPDLVLLNACHVGRVGTSRSIAGANRAAASVGRALLGLGVRAVVVAGWAVDNGAAEKFAASLIGGLGGGDDFGAAVTAARRAAWEHAPHSLTWGAYQCYGDPGFSLAVRTRRTSGDVHTIGELRRRTRRLASTASDQGRSASSITIARIDEVRKELASLEQRARDFGAVDIYADLAVVWADLLDLDQAIRLYQAALAQGASETPVRTIEQLGNLLSRRARHRAVRGEPDEEVSRDQKEATRWLRRALYLGRSGERLAMMAGFHKRAAAMSDGVDRARHLLNAISLYKEAYQTTGKTYHELNWRQLVAIASLNGVLVDVDPALREVRGADRPEAAADDPPDPTGGSPNSQAETASGFWHRAGAGDQLLTQFLAKVSQEAQASHGSVPPSDPSSEVGPLERKYTEAFRLRSNQRERSSVTEHLRDLVDLSPPGSPLAVALAEARSRLERWPNHDTAGAADVRATVEGAG